MESYQQLEKETLSGRFIAVASHQNIQHLAVLIARPPEVMRLTIDLDEDLIDMPFISRLPSPLA